MLLGGWGRFPMQEARLSTPRTESALIQSVLEGNAIARGNGRAYGDSAVSQQNTLQMRHFNHLLAFDEKTGCLVAEAGVLLADIIATFLPRGWFPYVTPGTKFVTVGGMIAADVHGKNHHQEGSIGQFVEWLEMIDADGIVQRCSRQQQAQLFAWTVGGMGLTGIILRAAIRLRPVETGWIKQTTIPATHLEAVMEQFEQTQKATYSVAWIDCLSSGKQLGRSLLMLGEHAECHELGEHHAQSYPMGSATRLSVPFAMPTKLLNSWTVRAFNQLYYRLGVRQAGTHLVEWDHYFYPLDSILGWNKIYGRKGFIQFQCVFPLTQSAVGLRALLKAITKAKAGSFLAVLKRLGEQNSQYSFPLSGYTLALDFPVKPSNLLLLDTLDRITVEHGGRFYLAKDSRMSAETLRCSDPRTTDFVRLRSDTGMRTRFSSAQSTRLAL